MRALIIGLLAATTLAFAAPTAFAASPLPPGTHPVVPSGNSGADQYIESVPTSKGNQPTGALPVGGSRQAPTGPVATVVPRSTRAALVHHGKTGINVIAFAIATAPKHRELGEGAGAAQTGKPVASGPGESAAPAILGSLTGLGAAASSPLLLVIMIAALLGAVVAAVRRTRKG